MPKLYYHFEPQDETKAIKKRFIIDYLVQSTPLSFISSSQKLLITDVKGVSANISATKGNDTAWTTFEIDVLPTEARDCDLITQDLCFWHSVSYRIYENSEPNLIGSLASPYLLQTCEGYDLNYTLVKGECQGNKRIENVCSMSIKLKVNVQKIRRYCNLENQEFFPETF